MRVPIMPRTKEIQVAEFLRERIISGALKRGQKLKQAELAAMLGVSITPVREALKLLEAEGYIVSESHKGMVVAPFQLDKVEELLRLRVLLEMELTEHATLRMTGATLKKLVDLNAEVLRNERRSDRDTNYRFHFTLYEAAGMPQTLHFVRVLWAKFPFDLLTAIPGRTDRVHKEHVKLLEALADRDPKRARRAIQEHLESGWEEFIASYPIGKM